jgi:hypothetical protein
MSRMGRNSVDENKKTLYFATENEKCPGNAQFSSANGGLLFSAFR